MKKSKHKFPMTVRGKETHHTPKKPGNAIKGRGKKEQEKLMKRLAGVKL